MIDDGGSPIMSRRRWLLVSLSCLTALLGASGPAAAVDFDGSEKLLCVPVEVQECTVGKGCERTTVDDVNLPQFIRIDFKKKTLSGTAPDGDGETTAIQNVQTREGEKTILQGAEGQRAWSIVIDQTSGKMSASVSDNRTGFVVFGACTAR